MEITRMTCPVMARNYKQSIYPSGRAALRQPEKRFPCLGNVSHIRTLRVVEREQSRKRHAHKTIPPGQSPRCSRP